VRELWRSIGFTSGARIYAVLAGAVGLIFTARALGPSGRGTVAAATTWALVFSTLGYLSLGQVAIHRATGKRAEEWLRPVLSALVAMTGIVTVAGWAVAAVLYAASNGEAFGKMPAYALVLGFAALPFFVWEQYGSWLLTAVGKISFYNRREVAGRTLGLVLIVVLVGFAGAGVPGALVALVVAQAVVAGAGWRYLTRLAGGRSPLDRALLRGMVLDGLKLHFNAVGTFLFAEAAILIVQSIRGPAETGPFQIAVQLLAVAILIPQAASMVLYGEVARLGPNGAWPANRRVLLTLGAGMAAIGAIAFLLAPVVVPLLFGHSFDSAVPVFQILVLGLVGQTFSSVMAPQWIGRGLFWQSSLMTLVLGVCNVVACIVLVHSYGMKGAAYSLLGVYTFSIFGNGAMAVWVSRRVKRDAEEPAEDAPAATTAVELAGTGEGPA
jgi:O-antigen/teichoic acid export membrane protein